MQGKITSELSFCLSKTGFSLDELVKTLADLFERKAMVELIRLILQLVQEVLMSRIFEGKSSMTCCHGGTLQLNGSYRRRIRCSVGERRNIDDLSLKIIQETLPASIDLPLLVSIYR